MKTFISILVTIVVMVIIFLGISRYKPEWINNLIYDQNGFPRYAKEGDLFTKGLIQYKYHDGQWLIVVMPPPPAGNDFKTKLQSEQLFSGSRVVKQDTFTLAKGGCAKHVATVIDNNGNSHTYEWYTYNGFEVTKGDCQLRGAL